MKNINICVSGSKVSVFKYVLVGLVIVGLVGWNAHLQLRLGKEREAKRNVDSKDEGVHSRAVRSVNLQGNSPQSGGAMFVRWGRSDCPNEESELVYSGIVGASLQAETGGSAEYICLTRDPQWATYSDSMSSGLAKIGGVEFEGAISYLDKSKSPSGTLQDADALCAVCRSRTRTSQVMIAGRKECYPGWTREYWGYLMTGGNTQKAQHSWACVDNTPEADQKGYDGQSAKSGHMFHVQGVCGSLPCPNYVEGRELTCVVCAK